MTKSKSRIIQIMIAAAIVAYGVARICIGLRSDYLAIATLGLANAPLPPLNATIALSILFLGPEIVRTWRGETSLTIRYPWVVAFLFGLLHGFGFASVLQDLLISPTTLAVDLVGFGREAPVLVEPVALPGPRPLRCASRHDFQNPLVGLAIAAIARFLMRRLREVSFRRILTFTRKPSMCVVLVLFGYYQYAQNTEGFRVFFGARIKT